MLALQRSAGNAAVSRLLQREAQPDSDWQGPPPQTAEPAGSDWQGPPPLDAMRPVDPAVLTLWGTTIVAPMAEAAEHLRAIPASSIEVGAGQAAPLIQRAAANAELVADKFDPLLRSRILNQAALMRKLSHGVGLIFDSTGFTYVAVAKALLVRLPIIRNLEPKLRPAAPAEPGGAPPATSKAIIQALYKANVVDKLTPLPARFVRATDATVAAEALPEMRDAVAHVYGLRESYKGLRETDVLYDQVAIRATAIDDLVTVVQFLADGTQPQAKELTEEATKLTDRLATLIGGL